MKDLEMTNSPPISADLPFQSRFIDVNGHKIH